MSSRGLNKLDGSVGTTSSMRFNSYNVDSTLKRLNVFESFILSVILFFGINTRKEEEDLVRAGLKVWVNGNNTRTKQKIESSSDKRAR